AVKWRFVLGKNQNAFGLHFLSKLAGNYSPGRVGELSPLLFKAHRSSRLGAWIVVDRLLEMTVTLAFGATGFFLLRFSSASVIPAVAGAFIVFIILPLALITRRRWFEGLAAKTSEGSRTRKALDGLAKLSDEMLRLRAITPVAGFLTIAAALLELAAYILLYRSFGAEGVTFAMVAAAKCAQGVVGALPFTPGPTGLPHLVAGVFLYEAGGFDSGVLAAALGSREVVVNLLFCSFLVMTSPGLFRLRKT
ncbi:MAG: lysylphosphatidylglycerol synthase domain-containing protein, partial [Desulfotignum sp.]